ncbi:hypothetical protein NH26_04320 [Flammeovirga pacifica]|uniref:Phage shock protein PspC N-terminal domain-containing protein n=2 Tax=Flammeovirga pacifica TaxID=915059 RepID=A0A1S1YXB2_FLAPC|nr:hypothetical protein NH26_04320 [Flammeovirga pacifica]
MSEESKALYDDYCNALYEHLKTFQDFRKIITELEYKLSELLIPFIEDEFDYVYEEELIHCLKIVGLPEGFQLPNDNTFDENPEIDKEAPSISSTKFEFDEKFLLNAKAKSKDFLLKLFRDVDRQTIGGVAAGVAHNLNIDPVIIRLLFISPFLLYSTTKIPLIFAITVYIIMWLFLPEKRNIKRDQNIKLFFRDKENKVLSGICAGLSNYFGINVIYIRLPLIGLCFYFHTLILLYIIFWIVTPYSRTLKDKFQSKGKAFTLEEVEVYLSKTINHASKSQKVLSSKLERLNSRLGTINIDPIFIDILKVCSFLVGAFLFISTILSTIIGVPVLAIALKTFQLTEIFNYIPENQEAQLFTGIDRNLLTTLQYSIPNTTAIIASIQFFTLQILLFLTSLSLMIFRKVVRTTAFIVLTILLTISSILLLTALNMSVHNFDNQATHKEEILIPLSSNDIELSLDNVGVIPLNKANINISPYNGNDLKFVFLQEAWGKTRERAIKNAKAIDYLTTIDDNKVILSSHYSFPRGVKYRNQKLSLNIFVPKGIPFMVNEELKKYLNDQNIFDFDEGFNHDIVYNEKGSIETYNNAQKPIIVSQNNDENLKKILISQKRFETGADSILLYGNINLNVIIDPNFKGCMLKYPKQQQGNDLKVIKNERNLRLYPSDFNSNKVLELALVTPRLNYFKFEGQGKIILNKLEADSLEINLSGNIEGNFKDIRASHVVINLKGASILSMEGKANDVYLTTNGGSHFNGSDFIIENIKAKTKGMSEMSVHALNNATIFQSPLSKVNVEGNPLHFEKHTQR